MIEVGKFVGCLKEVGIGFFTGVPDSLLKSFCAYVTDTCGGNHVIVVNDWAVGRFVEKMLSRIFRHIKPGITQEI